MKKLLLGAITALAFFFGFASCDGGMHDLAPAPMGVVGFDSGSDNVVVLMNMDNADGSEQSLKFTWNADAKVESATGTEFSVQEGWGKTSGVQFKIILPEGVGDDGKPNWSYDRSYSDTMAYITPGEDYLPLYPRGENGYSGADGQNISITGLADGNEYTLKALYDSATGKVQVKVVGESSNPEECRITFYTTRSLKIDDGGNVIKPNVYIYKNDNVPTNFPLEKEVKDDNGNIVKDADGNPKTEPIVRAMAKAGNTYTYRFIATEDEPESIKFVISNDGFGDSQEYTLDKKYLLKDFEYQITFTKNVDSTTYSYSVTNATRLPYLRYGEVLTNTQHSYDPYAEFSIVNIVSSNENYGDNLGESFSNDYWGNHTWFGNDYNCLPFTATVDDFEMTLNRVAGSNLMAWGKKNADITADGDEVELEYIDNRNLDAVKTFTPTPIKPIKISGLTKGRPYMLSFNQNTNEFGLLKAKVYALDGENNKYSGTSIVFVGGITDSTAENETFQFGDPLQTGFKVPLTNSKFEFTFTYNGTDSWGGNPGEHAFTIMSDDAVQSGWNATKRWGGATKMAEGKVGAYTAIGGANNIFLTGMTKSKKYKLVGTVYNDFIDMKLEEVK